MLDSVLDKLYSLLCMICCASSCEGCACSFCQLGNVEGVVDVSVRSSGSLFTVRCCRRILSSGHAVDVVIENDGSDIYVSSACVDQMVSADSYAVSVTCDADNSKIGICKLNACS